MKFLNKSIKMIEYVPWEYNCNVEYLDKFDEGKKFRILLITSCTPTKQTRSEIATCHVSDPLLVQTLHGPEIVIFSHF